MQHLSRTTTILIGIATSIAIWSMACPEADEFFPPEPDPSLTGTWSATFGQVTVRFDLRDDGGTITGDFSLFAPGVLEGNGQVTGTLSGVQVRLDTPYTVVPLPYDDGDRDGRPIGVRVNALTAPITLVRTVP